MCNTHEKDKVKQLWYNLLKLVYQSLGTSKFRTVTQYNLAVKVNCFL